MLEDNQMYIVVDIELNGLMPGKNSMLSIGAVASTADQEMGSFYKKVLPLEDLSADPETMEWWKTQPEAWQEVNANAESAVIVIEAFREWVKSFDKSPVFVASPLILDYPFIRWYLNRFGGEQLFEDFKPVQRTLDLASFTAGKLNIPLARSRRMQLPQEITQGMPSHSHKAIDDARGYGVILRNTLKGAKI
jgi:DNA polymerase III alpha subunit (gram-positive type)